MLHMYMCTYMYVCMYVCIASCQNVRCSTTATCTLQDYVSWCMCAVVTGCIYDWQATSLLLSMYVCIYKYTHIYIYIYQQTCIHAYRQAGRQTHIHACVCMCIYIYHMHIFIHMHTQGKYRKQKRKWHTGRCSYCAICCRCWLSLANDCGQQNQIPRPNKNQTMPKALKLEI